MKRISGERIAKTATGLRMSCSNIIFDSTRERLLLARRRDNGHWCLPGGSLEFGERVEETCIREAREETGLEVRVVRLMGIYSSANFVLEYSPEDRRQLITLSFEAEIVGGELKSSQEMSESGYFNLAEIKEMAVLDSHLERIHDALSGQTEAFIR